jgi:hypothetical protein
MDGCAPSHNLQASMGSKLENANGWHGVVLVTALTLDFIHVTGRAAIAVTIAPSPSLWSVAFA